MKSQASRSEEHTSELQSLRHLVCSLLLEKKKKSRDVEFAQRNGQQTPAVEPAIINHHGSSFMVLGMRVVFIFVFFFNDTATTEIYTLSLHDALPISRVLAEDLARQMPSARISVFPWR